MELRGLGGGGSHWAGKRALKGEEGSCWVPWGGIEVGMGRKKEGSFFLADIIMSCVKGRADRSPRASAAFVFNVHTVTFTNLIKPRLEAS